MDDELYDDDEMQDNEDFAAMLEQSLSGSTHLEIGQQSEAKVLQIGAEWAFLDVGQKGEGVLDVRELQDGEGNLTVAVGDTVKAYFMSRQGGEMRFTLRIGGGGSTGTAQLEEAWRSGIPVDGRIEKEVKGGYEVKLPGSVRAFCPFSQLGMRRQEDAAALVGQSFSFKITQFDEQGRNIVVSQRVLLEEERARQREELKKTLKEGMLVRGTVTSIRDFGAFVDIGGIEGLLPISEIAYGRVEKVSDVLAEGEALELAVKKIDWEANKFSFSLRDTLADPWGGVADKYKAGTKLSGTVSRLAPFGAFVTLEPGIDGLVHISRLGEGKHLKHPQEVVKVGDKLQVTVEKVDLEQHRISLVPTGAVEEPGETSYVDAPVSGSGMGSFADLLKAAQDKKNKKK